MLAILMSVLLFGFVHPLSKVILDSGIPLSFFCTLYVAIRLLIQTPIAILVKPSGASSRNIFLSLILLGICGAGLQFFEFKGVSAGLNPGVVTFLMFSYPIWIILGQSILAKNPPTITSFLKIGCGGIGIYFVCQNHFSGLQREDSFSMIYPIMASVFIAAWITISNKLRKQNVSALSLSLYYDLFSLVALFVLLANSLSQDWTTFLGWVDTPSNVAFIVLYSVFIGLVPNLLFYFGSRKVSAFACGMAMALEPVLSTMYSSFIWETSLGSSFFVGAIFILFANLPLPVVNQLFKEKCKDEKPKTLSSLENV